MAYIKNKIKRERRYFSHASADVKTSSWNPFSRSSAVLLDISQHGFKIELKGSKTLKAAQAFWLRIKLSSFDINTPKFLEAYVTTVWFDKVSNTGGGVFSDLTKEKEDIIDRVLDYLQENQPEVLSSNFDPTEEFSENSDSSDEEDDDDNDQQTKSKKHKKPKKKKKKNSFEDDLDDDIDDDPEMDVDIDDLLDD